MKKNQMIIRDGEYIKALNDKNTKLMAVDKETEVVHEVDSIHFPLGKPSGKDIAIICNDDKELSEWRSIGEVTLYVELVKDERV